PAALRHLHDAQRLRDGASGAGGGGPARRLRDGWGLHPDHAARRTRAAGHRRAVRLPHRVERLHGPALPRRVEERTAAPGHGEHAAADDGGHRLRNYDGGGRGPRHPCRRPVPRTAEALHQRLHFGRCKGMSNHMTIEMRADTEAPVLPVAATPLRPLGMGEIRIEGGFWGERQRLNGTSIIPHCLHWEERVGWVNNFSALLRGTLAEERQGREFSDSDVYKLLEAMVWEIGRTGDTALQQTFDDIVALIAACQQPDGYLNTKFDNPGQQPRYTDFEMGHELYNVGHLIQAAVARLRTGFDERDLLVQVALRAADHVCDVFREGGLHRVGGHPEIEVALVELYRATGEHRYLEQARVFLERRGRGTLRDIEFGRGYFQDDVPLREAEALRGHAVRALYLSAGAVDAGVELGDDELVDAIERQYRRTLARRTYVTGGMGSHHQDEAFGA